ncbi:hypothetical protein TGRUB_277830 [Toxoplasma gondii RUB]|uniref:Uncharacterized protein n=2 Tax=Toxoplasma gondii TaxID=5811 RepID=A0A086LPR6_TOXGO|nr:hypothetical protein TGP89_277830 [Toxoplasma gondii p89]KFG58634.1 hypothetical protein TGRUB_277830 [Toxoplasma gondii RUB]
MHKTLGLLVQAGTAWSGKGYRCLAQPSEEASFLPLIPLPLRCRLSASAAPSPPHKVNLWSTAATEECEERSDFVNSRYVAFPEPNPTHLSKETERNILRKRPFLPCVHRLLHEIRRPLNLSRNNEKRAPKEVSIGYAIEKKCAEGDYKSTW